MGHRQWLPPDHPWRRNKRRFNGAQKMVGPPEVLDVNEIMKQLKCVLYDLPYWKDQLLCHNIDVMHTEKKCR